MENLENGFADIKSSGNKAKIDLGSGTQTVSYTINGINLKLIELQIEAVKVTSPTEAEIKALP